MGCAGWQDIESRCKRHYCMKSVIGVQVTQSKSNQPTHHATLPFCITFVSSRMLRTQELFIALTLALPQTPQPRFDRRQKKELAQVKSRSDKQVFFNSIRINR
jgi:hypothetical protein